MLIQLVTVTMLWVVFIRKESHPNPFIVKQALRALYSPKAERVHELCSDQAPGGRFKHCREAGVSIGHAARQSGAAGREWIQAERKGPT